MRIREWSSEGGLSEIRPGARRGEALRQGGLNRKKLDLAAALPKVPATMDLQFHNTLTRRKERFAPLDPQHVRMYVCGPTVYDFAHIGNARPVVVFDVLFRLLRHDYGEEQVTYSRHITDVDDKILPEAKNKI